MLASQRMNQGAPQAQRDDLFELRVREITSDRDSASLGVCFTAQCVHSNAVVCCTIGKSSSIEAEVAFAHISRAYQGRDREAGTVQVRVLNQARDGSLVVDLIRGAQAGCVGVFVTPKPVKRRRYYK